MSMTSNSSMLSINDRRAHLRTDVSHEVAYDYYSYDGERLGKGYGITVNMSAGGLMLDTDKPLEAAMKLLIEIISPLYAFMATGLVVYAYQLDERHFRVGVHFEEIIQGGWELMSEISRL